MARPKGTVPVLTRRKLAKELSYLLEMPYKERSKSYKIVRAVFTAMSDALLRGESVVVAGFGKFWVTRRGPYERYQMSFRGGDGPDKSEGSYSRLAVIPAYYEIRFRPTQALKSFIAQGVSNVRDVDPI